jgi:hypothetical protein
LYTLQVSRLTAYKLLRGLYHRAAETTIVFFRCCRKIKLL